VGEADLNCTKTNIEDENTMAVLKCTNEKGMNV